MLAIYGMNKLLEPSRSFPIQCMDTWESSGQQNSITILVRIVLGGIRWVYLRSSSICNIQGALVATQNVLRWARIAWNFGFWFGTLVIAQVGRCQAGVFFIPKASILCAASICHLCKMLPKILYVSFTLRLLDVALTLQWWLNANSRNLFWLRRYCFSLLVAKEHVDTASYRFVAYFVPIFHLTSHSPVPRSNMPCRVIASKYQYMRQNNQTQTREFLRLPT